jgi:hypothetical protein
MLALMPVVALAAACNGVAPTAPSGTDLSNGVSANQEGSAAATGLVNQACANVAGIDLQVVEISRTMVFVEASYKYNPQRPNGCRAVEFTSNRPGLEVDKINPFRAGALRSLGGEATIKAAAPNGVSKAITVQLGGTSSTPSAPSAPSTPGTPSTPSAPSTPNSPDLQIGCKYIDEVAVSVVQPASDGGDVVMTAQYHFSTPLTSGCSTAPTWQATRKGLSVNPLDGFKASIPAAPEATTVLVTAPSGVQAKVRF